MGNTSSNVDAFTAPFNASTPPSPSLSVSSTIHSLQLQLPTGTHDSPSLVCFLFLEGWSSWLYILHFLGFRQVCIVDHLKPIPYSMFHKHYTLSTWNFTQFTVWFASNPATSALVLLEGSSSSLTSWCQQLSVHDFFHSCHICVLAKTRLRSFRFLPGLLWHKLHHHRDCGGVSNFSFQIGISSTLSWNPSLSSEHGWELPDILEPAHGGLDCLPPSRSLYLLASRSLSDFIQAPSVFSSGGWVHRHLLPSEVLRVFDVPKVLDGEILAGFNADTWSGGDFDFNDIVTSVPGKICLCLMKHLGFSYDTLPSSTAPLISSDLDYTTLIKGDFNPVSEEQTDVVKSVKADDAEVPIGLWNKQIFIGSSLGIDYDPSIHDKPLEVLRELWAMRWYRKRLFHSFSSYMRKQHGINWAHALVSARRSRLTNNLEIRLDGEVGCDALSRAINARWWTWDFGSTLIFWRWPTEVIKEARDGSRLPWKFFPMPSYKVPQKYPKDHIEKSLMIQKVLVPINRGYIAPGRVKSLSGFFSVPKGPTDIRLVYDMTKCGLNKCLWSPRFYLPCPDSLFDSIEYDSFMSDIDQGEMFLNYFSDPDLL